MKRSEKVEQVAGAFTNDGSLRYFNSFSKFENQATLRSYYSTVTK